MGITQKELTAQLAVLGIRKTDVLTVHTSLKSIGPIEAATPDTAGVLIAALRDAVADGLLLIPSHTYANVREVPVFDARRTMPCIGAVPCRAVELANEAYDRGDRTIVRSLHPDHSLVAFGRDAAAFTAGDASAASPMPPCGCYRKLPAAKAKILFIGVGLERNTFVHAVDEELHPEELGGANPVTVIDCAGTVTPRVSRNCHGPSRKYAGYEPFLREAGALTYGTLGEAKAILCDAALCRQVVLERFNEVMER